MSPMVVFSPNFQISAGFHFSMLVKIEQYERLDEDRKNHFEQDIMSRPPTIIICS